ncbi:MAG: glycoside hydrolase family 3 N-terminal domain-containing protein [Solirubrobacteraceae bacterium]
MAARLSIQQLAGQRVIYAYSGSRPPASLLSAIRAGEAGGVILFGDNISSREQIRSVIGHLQHLSLASPIHDRLLVMIDQEGGEVRRLPGAPTLSERQIGRSRHAAALASAAGAAAGRNLRGVGINVNLTPVLDVYRSAGDFIDRYQRSYSRSALAVGTLGSAFVAAQQRTGVAATAKHFPGLGSAAVGQDTDLLPVTLRVSLARLRATDEAPYASAIVAGVKLVMSSWAVYPALDPRLPAGLSQSVIGGELRGRLGYRGVTITDAIGAGALRSFGSVGRRAVLAARAGADLILCTSATDANTPAAGIAVRRSLASAIARGQLSATATRAAVTRVLTLRAHP